MQAELAKIKETDLIQKEQQSPVFLGLLDKPSRAEKRPAVNLAKGYSKHTEYSSIAIDNSVPDYLNFFEKHQSDRKKRTFDILSKFNPALASEVVYKLHF